MSFSLPIIRPDITFRSYYCITRIWSKLSAYLSLSLILFLYSPSLFQRIMFHDIMSFFSLSPLSLFNKYSLSLYLSLSLHLFLFLFRPPLRIRDYTVFNRDKLET